MAANSSCKPIPRRTTLSRGSNREIDGLKSIERGMNFTVGKKETSNGESQNFSQNFCNLGKIFLKPLLFLLLL